MFKKFITHAHYFKFITCAWLLLAMMNVYAGSQPGGLTPHATYTADVFWNPSGGQRTGSTYLGLFDIGFEADLQSFLGIPSTTLFANAYYLHGESATEKNIGDFNAVSNMDADNNHIRLFEFYLQHSLWDEQATLIWGQLAADSYFFVSETSSLFVNSTFGWAPAAVQTTTPVYAQAALGIIFQQNISSEWSWQIGWFNNEIEDPETNRNARHGTQWELPDLHRSTLVAEIIHTADALLLTLPSTAKLGYWHDTSDFADNTHPIKIHDSNWGLYAIIDQWLYQEASDTEQGLTAFLRFAYTPKDRNQFTYYTDFGITYQGMFSDADALGLAFSHGFHSNDFESVNTVSDESVIELSYATSLCEHIALQPNIQFIKNPGGPNGSNFDDAWVLGLRVQISY